MKISFLVLFTFLSIKVSNSQTIVVVDFETKETIPYTTIQNIKDKTGFYTENNGSFSFMRIKGDSINISHVSYQPLKLKASEIIDSIFLKPNINMLEEVEIVKGVPKTKVIGYIKKRKTLSWNIKEKNELATLIKYQKKYQVAYIKKIHIPIGKMQLDYINNKVIESYPKFNSVFRVHIYSNSGNGPKNELLSKPLIIECNQNSSDIIEIDISDELIKLPEQGVFIGVEMIGELGGKKKLLDKKDKLILPSFKFTKKKKNNISSVSFVKTISDIHQWKHISNHNQTIKDFSEYNMAINLELEIYD